MATTGHIIDLINLTVSYPRRTVLDKLSFHVHAGDKVGLIGPNGSGKTTLLHAIMGLNPVDSGEINLFGREMKTEKDFAWARKKLGFVFQNADDQLFSPTVLEDVAFGPLNLGKSPDEAREIARKTLDSLGLSGFENRVSYRLSGGEKRLVSIATVLSMEPEALILDEPTTGLDETTRERIAEILASLKKTLVVVSHEYEFLARTTNSFYGMKNGTLNYLGDSEALHTHVHMHTAGELPHKH